MRLFDVPARCEMDVEAYAILPNLKPTRAQWATQPTILKAGLMVAATLLPERAMDLTLRVMNPTNQVIQLKKGAQCNLEEVTVVEIGGGDTPLVHRADVSKIEELSKEGTAEAALTPLWTDIAEDVPVDIRERLRRMVLNHRDAFSIDEWDLWFTDIIQHEIDTGNETPVRQPLRRQPLTLLPVIDEQVELMLQQGLIEPSMSAWASNVVMVQKRDGTPRFCVDYRAVNNKTRKDAYPLPLISESLDALAGAQWFSTFDLRAGYHQVAVHPRDRHKTAFLTRRGSFQFKVLPFGLCNSPSSFSRMMGLVMAGLNFEICLIYLDDIIVFAEDLGTHLDRLQQVLDRLTAAHLKLKPSKCHLLQKRVLFLGHVVSAEGIATDPEKVVAVRDWPTPTKVKEVRAFIGLSSYYRKFVPDLARIARPLHALTKKGAKFLWTDGCEAAFRQLKRRLTEAPVLALPNDSGMYVLDTDASGEAIGAVLSQVQDQQERVICYGSRVCSPAEQNYDVTRRELLAIVHFLKTFRPYLLGRKFLLRTDHSALQWLWKTPLPIGQQARWLNAIEEFEFDVKHRAGSAHLNADAMSRRPHPVQVIRELENDTTMASELWPDWNTATIGDEQRRDPDLGWVIRRMEASTDMPSADEIRGLSSTIKTLVFQWPQLEIRNGLLMRRWITVKKNEDGRSQLIPPEGRRSSLIRWTHEGMSGGHLGLRRTLSQVQRRAYWPGWRELVRGQLLRCQPCARYMRAKLPRQGYLQSMIVGEPMERIGIDITGPHPVSSKGHRFILTVIDHFSRWAEAYPIRNQEAVTVARVLTEQWISRFGCPKQLLTDQGPCFEAALFRDLCRLLQIDKLRTSPYKPSSNGAIERFHRTLNSMLAKIVAEKQRDWDSHLPFVMAAYRASENESTGYSPNRLFLGRENCLPIDLILGDCYVKEEPANWDDYVLTRAKHVQHAFTLARASMKRQAISRACRYDLRVRPATFTVGSWVWYYYPRKRPGIKDKWARWYTGPYKIIEQLGPVLYKIQSSRRAQPKVVYVDKLKRYYGDTPKDWDESTGPVLDRIELPLPEVRGKTKMMVPLPDQNELLVHP